MGFGKKKEQPQILATADDRLEKGLQAIFHGQVTDIGTETRIKSFAVLCNGINTGIDAMHTEAVKKEKERHARTLRELEESRERFKETMKRVMGVAQQEKMLPADDLAEKFVGAVTPPAQPVKHVDKHDQNIYELTKEARLSRDKTDEELDVPAFLKREAETG